MSAPPSSPAASRLGATMVLLLAAGAAAQTVHVVGPGGHARIGDAIALATAGDVIQVAPGSYPPFTLDKALSIVAAAGALVTPPTFGSGSVRLRPPAGTTATLAGLTFQPPVFTWSTMEVRIERGTVACTDCVFEAPAQFTVAGLHVENATAVLERCTLLGNGVLANRAGVYNAGLSARNAAVFASDCTMRGSHTAFDSYGGAGEGVRLSAATGQFVRCTIEGGRRPSCLANGPAPGVLTIGACDLWLADCTVRGGADACGTGEVGLRHAATAPAQLARTTLRGGVGSTGTAAPSVGPTVTAPLLGLSGATMPMLGGAPWSIPFQTEPHWPLFVLVGFDLLARNEPLVAEPVLLHGGLGTLAVLVADAAGQAPFQTTVPANPALRHARVFVQGVTWQALPLHTAPPLGGNVR